MEETKFKISFGASIKRIRKNKVFKVIWPIVQTEPVINTRIQAKMTTTTVLSAVATLESVFFSPTLAKIAVRPANSADKNASKIHMVKFNPLPFQNY